MAPCPIYGYKFMGTVLGFNAEGHLVTQVTKHGQRMRSVVFRFTDDTVCSYKWYEQ